MYVVLEILYSKNGVVYFCFDVFTVSCNSENEITAVFWFQILFLLLNIYLVGKYPPVLHWQIRQDLSCSNHLLLPLLFIFILTITVTVTLLSSSPSFCSSHIHWLLALSGKTFFSCKGVNGLWFNVNTQRVLSCTLAGREGHIKPVSLDQFRRRT